MLPVGQTYLSGIFRPRTVPRYFGKKHCGPAFINVPHNHRALLKVPSISSYSKARRLTWYGLATSLVIVVLAPISREYETALHFFCAR